MTDRHPSWLDRRPEDKTDVEWAGQKLLILLTLVELLVSVLWVGAICDVIFSHTETLSPRGLCLFIVLAGVGLFIFGVSLYTLKVTHGWRYWDDLARREKTVALLSIGAGIAVIATTCIACYLLFTWAQSMAD
jgi:hypothetical protein